MSEDAVPTVDPKDDEWLFTIHHSQVYKWEPVREEDVPEDAVVVDSYFEGFKMIRRTEDGDFTSTSGCHVPSIQAVNDEREASGKPRRPDWLNLVQELADGSWSRQFPVGSITKVEVLQGPADIADNFQIYLGIGANA